MNSSLFGTKAETLERLAACLRGARVLSQVRFTVGEWVKNPTHFLQQIQSLGWHEESLIVRSSALLEDRADRSWAGHFLSIPDVFGEDSLKEAIGKVAQSLAGQDNNQIFIQPFLKHVTIAGVAFSRDPNTGGPYYVVNYEDAIDSVDKVTSGRSDAGKVFYFSKSSIVQVEEPLWGVISLLRELEALMENDALDVEFAIDCQRQLYLLQVRPLSIKTRLDITDKVHHEALARIHHKIQEASNPHPYLYGSRTVYGVMPDWNPAEMIGIRPRPLALSLYRELITDNIWAYQRDNYGYRNLRSFPLLLSFCGLPYIDVRVSFNSFIPADLEPVLGERLVDYYIGRLANNPCHHDKVEFDVIYSCYTLDLLQRLSGLKEFGFSGADCRVLSQSLRALTNRIIHGKHGLWRNDIEKIKELEFKCRVVLESRLDIVSKIYWLLEDCKRYGTLPFAGLARAAFIAVQLLKSLVHCGVLSGKEYEEFMASLDTVGSRITRDFRQLSRKEFLKLYGHLRPGTYDILSPRYDEEPDRYFDWTSQSSPMRSFKIFVPSDRQLELTAGLLKEHGLDYDARSFFNFIKEAIEGREYAKFVFSKSLSDALTLFKTLTSNLGFSTEDASCASIGCVQSLCVSSEDPRYLLKQSVENGKSQYAVTKSIVLPPLICAPDDVWAFQLPPTEPNFITQAEASGGITFEKDEKEKLRGNILFLTCADPGYDWIFAHGIAGFVTMYGGVNSHMAIRAAELGIPAVIGAGEVLYSSWSVARRLRLDCANKRVQVLS